MLHHGYLSFINKQWFPIGRIGNFLAMGFGKIIPGHVQHSLLHTYIVLYICIYVYLFIIFNMYLVYTMLKNKKIDWC